MANSRKKAAVRDKGSARMKSYAGRTLDNMLEGCQLVGFDWRYLYVNDAAARHGRRSKEELLGRGMGEVYPGIESTGMFAALRRCATDRVPVNMENEFTYPDGSKAWFELRMEPMPEGVFILSIDVTERRKAQLALEESVARYRSLTEASFDAISIVQDGVIREVNRGFLEIFGYSRIDEVLGRSPIDLVAPDSREEVMRRLQNGIEGTYELTCLRKDGRKILLEATAKAHTIAARPARITALRDVTDKRTLEAQFRQAQKMEAVGRLAGGVAHDFNNLLTVITGNTELLLQQLAAGDPRREELEQIRKAADGAAGLTRQLLAFSRQQVVEPKILAVNDVVASTRRLLEPLIGEDIEVATSFSAEPCIVHIDPGQLEQVIMNLAVNARDAMPTGGKLTMETRVADVDDAGALKHWPASPGRCVLLAVSDNGVGMDAETIERIFEPFFTTKEAGKGTGLGLATVYGIVKQAGGFIGVYSEPGLGTTFKIYLPLVESSPVPEIDKRDLQTVRGGTETVLLVEDSGPVRDVARRVLQRHGYIVMETASASDALAMARKQGIEIHLLLTDVVMPQMSGRVLAERFLEIHPRARVLYMSGYTDDAIVRHGVLVAGTPYLHKPFTPYALATKVREVLDGA